MMRKPGSGAELAPRGLGDIGPSTSTLAKRKKLIKNKRYGGVSDEFLETEAPSCSSHNMTAKLLTVKKVGPNKVCHYSSK